MTGDLAPIIGIIEASADLAAFVEGNFGRPLTVKPGFRRRDEIGLDELPIIRVTRPRRRTDKTGLRVGVNHYITYRLYAGIYHESPEEATALMLELEDILADLFINNEATLGLLEEATSANDEGTLPPAHFLVMDVTFRVVATHGYPFTDSEKPFRGQI